MKIFITGISGTLGQVVSRMLLARGHQVVGFSRDEQKQIAIERCDNLTLYLGDVRDRDRIVEATRGCEMILHFAALKIVPILEENPEEAVHTNIVGTQNVLHAQRINGIPRVVMASTDKAVYPINVYGASKMAAERLVLRNENNVVCRYGNVLGSRGSVLPFFIESLKSEIPHVEITDVRMTRFWTTVERAASFVITSALEESGGLKIPLLSSATVLAVVDAVADILGVPSYDVEDVGIRPGEKIHECLRTSMEAADGVPVYSNDLEMEPEDLGLLVAEAMRGM